MFLHQTKRALSLFYLGFLVFVGIRGQSVNDIRVTAQFVRVPLIAALSEIEKKYDVKFFYKPEWFVKDTITYTCESTPLTRLLDRIVDSRPLVYQVIQDQMVVFLPKEMVVALTGQAFAEGAKGDVATILVGDPMEAGKYSRVELKGKIRDGKTGETIIGANLQIEKTTIGCVSDVNGSFSMKLAPGKYSFLVSSVGYEKSVYKLNIVSNGSVDLELFEKSIKIDEISIYAQRPDKNVRGNQMSLIDMDSKSIKQLPSLVGERDVLKSFTMMPGVKSVGEFGSGINVRGGGEDQNLYLIEGAPIFNTSHVFGLLSVLNPDAIKNVTLYKGQIPAEFGERVASVMDITVRDNNCKTFTGIGGVGLYNARLLLEGPVVTDKLTFKLGFRKSYSDWLLKEMKDYNLRNSAAAFYDLNGLLNYSSKNDMVSLFAYTSSDAFKYAKDHTYAYGNVIGALNWSHFFSNSISSLLTLAQSNYDASRDDVKSEYERKVYSNYVHYTSLKYNFKIESFAKHDFDAGIQAIRYQNLSGKVEPMGQSIIKATSLPAENAYELAFYAGDVFDVNEKLSVSAGLRFSTYFLLGSFTKYFYTDDRPVAFSDTARSQSYKRGATVVSYKGLEPRLSLKYMLNTSSSVKVSYNRNFQYLSLLSYSSLSMPSDIWKLADPYLKPVQSDQLAFGYFKNMNDNEIEISAEVYYKLLKNLTEYRNNASLEMNPYLETQLLHASGKNYGLELMLKKNKGALDGWVSYTYSRALRQTNGKYRAEQINNNTVYPSSYDKPHDLTVSGTYHVNKRLRIGGNFNYTTGRSVSLPEYSYMSGGNNIVVFLNRNKYRLPNYHRLDISMSLDESLRIRKKWKGSWTFSVLNVYARKNAYSVFYKKETPTVTNNFKTFSLYKLYIFSRTPIPTLTYNFIF